jgi:hypothetical protein
LTEKSADYCTGDEISQEYAVGPQRLLAFAMRGNLPMRVEDGQPLFDRGVVAKLFRRRDAPEGQGMTLGGGFRLGDSLAAPAKVPAARHVPGHSVRVPRAPRSNEVVLPPRKAEVA